MRKKTEAIKAKYERYVQNLEWHIGTNKPEGDALEQVNKQIGIYREIIADLEKIAYY